MFLKLSKNLFINSSLLIGVFVSLNIEVAGISIFFNSFLSKFKFIPHPTITPFNFYTINSLSAKKPAIFLPSIKISFGYLNVGLREYSFNVSAPIEATYLVNSLR